MRIKIPGNHLSRFIRPLLDRKNSTLLIFLCLLSFSLYSQKAVVYFKPNSFKLSASEKHKIDSLSRRFKKSPLLLQGFCDLSGTDAYNDALSLKRVEEVKKQFLKNDFPLEQITIKSHGKRILLSKSADTKQNELNRCVQIQFSIRTPSVRPAPVSPHQFRAEISGQVVNEKNEPIAAEIAISDENGKIILDTVTDKTGNYRIHKILNKSNKYSLNFYNDNSFIGSKAILPPNTFTGPATQSNTIVLKELKEGLTFNFENLLFVGNEAEILPVSLPALATLGKLMLRNQLLIIQIEGHVNHPSTGEDPKKTRDRLLPARFSNDYEHMVWLSEERAATVYNFLLSLGVSPERMSKVGYAAERMLYPDPKTDQEMEANRRVEIKVIRFK